MDKNAYDESSKQELAPNGEDKHELSVDFYQQLLKLPPCKLGKPCNNCGRCEH